MSLVLARRIGDRREEAANLYQLGYIAANQGEFSAARQLFEESLALFRALGERLGQARVLAQLGYLPSADGEDAQKYTEEGLALSRQAGDQVNICRRMVALATLACRKSDYDTARQYIEQALPFQRKMKLKHDLAESLDVYGRVAFRLGDQALAYSAFTESIALNDELGRSGENIWARVDLAYLYLRQGHFAAARQGFLDSLRLVREGEYMGGVTYIIEGLASLAVAQVRMETAARLFAWADGMRRKIGSLRPANEQADVEQDLALIRLHLDPAALETAQAAGQGMPLEEMVAFVQADRAG